ncbi:MAG: hypothetical protein D6B25_17200 [Desulfobulbaceae bacterium]|nr:MAG: hypothetical protein D6B25_17200 [Desulfobulbaceae bacterium]
MGPLRLIILAILLYIGYRLIRKSLQGNNQAAESESSGKTDDPRITDVLVECPVCSKLTPKQQAIVVQENDQEIYLCSEKCCREYTSEKGEE